MSAQVLVLAEVTWCRRILQDDALSGAEDVLENGLWQISGLAAAVTQIDRYLFITAPGFGLDPVGVTLGQDQYTSLGPGNLHPESHDSGDQRLQVGLTLHCFRHLEHGCEIQVLNWRQYRPGRIGRRMF